MLPDLAKEIAWWQGQMKPSDPTFGVGISDWTITAEYVDGLSTPDHGQVWGLTCSPSSLPAIVGLTEADIEAKRAHIMIRTPKSAGDVAELHETIPHELVHVLDARKTGSVDDMENTAHSLAPLLAELRKNDPARAATLARAISHPAMARAYRAPTGDDMPDPNIEPGGDKKPPEGDKPKAQEGAPRDVSVIEQEIAKTKMAGQPVDALLDELVLALVARGADTGGVASVPPPAPEPPTMGMKPDEAYARVQGAYKEAVEAIIEANPHLSKEQVALARKQPTPALARELVATYPRPSTQPEKPTMGLLGHPSTVAGGGKPLTVLARAVSEAQADPLFRKAMGIGSADNDGINYEVPGHIVYVDGSERLRHQRDAHRNRRAAK